MKQIEFFFDYTCSYCQKEMLKFLDIKNDLDAQILYRPIEIHPYPEDFMHSDLAAAGAYCLQERNGDIDKYHRLIYKAYFMQHKSIDDAYLIMNYMTMCGISISRMELDAYIPRVKESNTYIWNTMKAALVPSYIVDGVLKVGSHETKNQLIDDLK